MAKDSKASPRSRKLPLEFRSEYYAAFLEGVMANLHFSLAEIKHPALVLTSALRKEGVSTIVYHLSQQFASKGRTLVIDANFLAPSLQDFWGLSNQQGLSDVLLGSVQLKDAIQTTSQPNVDVLTTGPVASAAYKVLGTELMKNLIMDCKVRYQTVLIDAPAVRLCAETGALSAFADGVVLVVRARKTKRQLIQYSQEILDKAGANQLGVILNRVRFWIPEFLYRRL